MTFTQIMKQIFVKKPVSAKDNSKPKGGKFRSFLSRLPGGFMLPISVMAIAGLFMGIGTAIEINTSANVFGSFLKNIGQPVFGAMPILFLVAIIIAFTDEAGVAVFAGVVSFLVFNSLQSPFINASGDGINGTATFLGINTSLDIQSKMYSLIGVNLGISSINTSIFGGIIIGLIVAWTYNHFYQIELPAVIAFFGGKRFVAIISIIIMIPLVFLFLLVWPWIGLAFAYFGEYSAKVSGVDSFFYGFLERATIPFGLPWAILAPLKYTSAGGDVLDQFSRWNGLILKINGEDILATFNTEALNALKDQLLAVGGLSESNILAITNATGENISQIVLEIVRDPLTDSNLIDQLANIDGAFNYVEETNLNAVFINKIIASGTYTGDVFGWLAVNGSGIEKVTYSIDGQTYTEAIFPFLKNQVGINLGRFGIGGAVPIQQFGLPAAAMAMVMAAPKSRRKEAFSICFPAALTSLVAGVTEPLEYTFLFLVPWLFFGFHVLMQSFAYLFANLLNVHFASTFSGGLLDTIVYGIIPMAKGTNFYWSYLIGVVYAPIYFFLFYYVIKRFDIKTPGRGTTTKLFTKKDYKNLNNQTLTIQEAQLIQAMGGWENITTYNTCASRLRYDIKNKSLVDEEKIKAAGAIGIVWNNQNLQTIIGTKAEQMNTNIKKHIGANLDQILKDLETNKSPKTKSNKTSKNRKEESNE